jgi:predicted metalloprotease with PDZ domain
MQVRTSRVVSLSVLLLCGAAVFGADMNKCNQSSRECEQEIRQMLAGRLYLGIEVEEMSPGLVIKSIAPDSPASRAEMKTGDRLMAVNGRTTEEASIKDFKQIIKNILDTNRGNGRLFIIVLRHGQLRKLDARLEPYSKAQIDKIVAQHLLEAHPATAQQVPPPKGQ